MSTDNKKAKKAWKTTVAKLIKETVDAHAVDKVAHYTTHYEEGKKCLQKAVELDEKSRDERINRAQICELYKDALAHFRRAVEISAKHLSAAQKLEIRDSMIKLDGYIKGAQERFETLIQQIENDNRILVRGIPPIQQPVHRVSRVQQYKNSKMQIERSLTPHKNSEKEKTKPLSLQEKILKGVDPQIGARLLADILQDTDVTLADIAGCEQAKIALEEAVLLPSMNPELFKGLRQPVRGILLFGPPGNGKTLLAKALAGESKQTFFNISASSLTSKWVGDGEKSVKALFQMARNAQPCIVFIDEIDSILTERTSNDTDAGRRLKTEFLLQVDGAGTNTGDRIFILGATNRPYELDDAVLRRFPKRILLNLPDDAARFNLIKCILKKYNLSKGITDSDIRYIASRTSGYSYSDLTNLCKEASMIPVRDIDRKKLVNTKADNVRHLKTSDFDKALSAVKPSTNQEQLDKLQDFAKRSGQSC